METEAPAGYTKVESIEPITIDGNTDEDHTDLTYKVNVLNKAGGLLPETGGIGTTIFYILGGILLVTAFVLLVSKKRMTFEE